MATHLNSGSMEAAAAVAIGCLLLLATSAHGCSSVSVTNLSGENRTVCTAQTSHDSTSNDFLSMELLPGSSKMVPLRNCSWPLTIWVPRLVHSCVDMRSRETNSAEFNLSAGQQDSYRLSTVNGYSIGLTISPQATNCGAPRCYIHDIYSFCRNPNQFELSGGPANSTTSRCLSSGRDSIFPPLTTPPAPQEPTRGPRQFKDACPTSYTYMGDSDALFNCSAGTHYNVSFLDNGISLNDSYLVSGTLDYLPGTSLNRPVIAAMVVASLLVSLGSALVLLWRWRVYVRRHQQDLDLIAQLQERETATALMSLRELRRATDNFSEACQIGEGGFGTVYRGQLEDGTPVAIKRSKRQSSPEHKQQFLNEVKILTKVHHRNLVKLLGCSLANRTALLVLEYVPNGTLKDHLRNPPNVMTWGQRLRIALQTADALAYLHSATNPPIYHLDVKSANILLDQNLNAKVADFGISKLAPALDSSHITALEGIPGTIGYMDPEAFMSSHLSGKSDVYSFGVLLLELITAQPAVVDTNKSLVSWATELISCGQLDKILDPGLCHTFDESAMGMESITSVAKLAAMCLRFRSRKRPSMREVWIALQVVWDQCQPILMSSMDMGDQESSLAAVHEDDDLEEDAGDSY